MSYLKNINSKLYYCFIDPLEQFAIVPIIWISAKCPSNITNMTVFLVLNFLLIHIIFAGVYNRTSILHVWIMASKNIYYLVKNIIKSNTMLKRYQYFSNLFFLFLFIFISNLIGLIPYSFTVTSSFIVTFFLALTHFTSINIIGSVENRNKIFNMFLPSGVPLAISPILVPIENVSYIARVFSLSIRLFANMMSGHALLKILIGFSWTLLGSGIIGWTIALLPWLIVLAIIFLELLIAFLQSYVFVILIAIYINDVVSDH